MITTTTLYTVRHGLSENNIEQGRKILLPGLIQTVSKALGSNAAVLLTELLDQVIREKSSKYPLADRNVALGKERFAQAYLTGEKLSNLDINPEIILASTYLRAKQTAGEIQNGYQTATKRRVPITYHEFLTERYVGDHFGYPFDYYKYLFPESYLQYLKEGELIYRPPNGESKQDVWDRIKGNLERTLMPFSGKVILMPSNIDNFPSLYLSFNLNNSLSFNLSTSMFPNFLTASFIVIILNGVLRLILFPIKVISFLLFIALFALLTILSVNFIISS